MVSHIYIAKHKPVGSTMLRNRMVTRCCILIGICCSLGLAFILEQPASSVLQWHPDFQLLCKRFNIFRVSCLQQITMEICSGVSKIGSLVLASHSKVFIWIGSYGGGRTLPGGCQWCPQEVWPQGGRLIDSKYISIYP